jgi:hypothetical protein
VNKAGLHVKIEKKFGGGYIKTVGTKVDLVDANDKHDNTERKKIIVENILAVKVRNAVCKNSFGAKNAYNLKELYNLTSALQEKINQSEQTEYTAQKLNSYMLKLQKNQQSFPLVRPASY